MSSCPGGRGEGEGGEGEDSEARRGGARRRKGSAPFGRSLVGKEVPLLLWIVQDGVVLAFPIALVRAEYGLDVSGVESKRGTKNTHRMRSVGRKSEGESVRKSM
jgi:hypothetical protein